jgi:phenylacetic acid degradation operon negative regulatory protein
MYGTRSFGDIGINREAMAQFCCNYDEIEAAYQGFCTVFSDAGEAIEQGDSAPGDQLFLLRLLLVHEFRRIVLKDPGLPAELLPQEWAGDTARRLAGNIYRAIRDDAARHFMGVCEQDDEPVAAMSGSYRDRFSRVC